MKNTIKQTFFLSVSNGFTRLMAMLFLVMLARFLTVAEYGTFRYLLALSAIYGLAFSGLPTALTKFLGENITNPKISGEYLANSIALSAVIFVPLAILIFFATPHGWYLVLFTFALMIDLLYTGYSRGILNYFKLNAFKLSENIVQLAILITAFAISGTITLSFSIIFYSFSGIIVLMILELRQADIRPKLRLSFERMKEIIKYTIPVTLGSVGWTILMGITSIYIEEFSGIEAVGYYSVALTIMQIFSFFPDALITVLMPKVAAIDDKSRIIKPIIIANWIIITLSLMLFIPLFYFRESILTIVFSSKYLPSAIAFLPVALAQVSLTIHQVYAAVFQGLGKPSVPSITIGIAATINIIAGYVLTISYGLLGAAYALSISSLVAAIIISLYWQVIVSRGELNTVTAHSNGGKL